MSTQTAKGWKRKMVWTTLSTASWALRRCFKCSCMSAPRTSQRATCRPPTHLTITSTRHLNALAAANSPYHALAVEMYKSEELKAKMEAFDSKRMTLETYMPRVEQAIVDLERAPLLDPDGNVPELFVKVFGEVVVPTAVEIPKESGKLQVAYESKARSSLAKVSDACKGAAEARLQGKPPSIDVGNLRRSAKALLTTLRDGMPSLQTEMFECEKHLEQLEDSEAKVEATGRVRQLLDQKSAIIKPRAPLSDEAIQEINEVADVVNMHLEKPAGALGCLSDKLTEFAQLCVMAAMNGDTVVEPAMLAVAQVLSWLPPSPQQATTANLFDLLAPALDLKAFRERFLALGDDDDARIATAEFDGMLKQLLVAAAAAYPKHDQAGAASPAALHKEVEAAKQVVEATQNALLKQHMEKLTAMNKECVAHLAAASLPYDMQQGKNATWDEFLTSAQDSFMQYAQGDELRATSLQLKALSDRWKADAEMFGVVANPTEYSASSQCATRSRH